MKLVLLVNLFVLVLQYFERTETAECKPEIISTSCNSYVVKSTSRRTTTSCGQQGWWWDVKTKYCTKYSTAYISALNRKTCYKSIIHGCWSSWSGWSTWSLCADHEHHMCNGRQNKTRTRVCDNPKPSNGGRDCPGSSNHNFIRSCPMEVNGDWSLWGNWRPISPCSNSCGKGWNIMIRERSCTNPTPQCGGKICKGSTVEHKMAPCNSKKLCGRGGK